MEKKSTDLDLHICCRCKEAKSLKLLPCLHISCESCILLKNGTQSCGLCGSKVSSDTVDNWYETPSHEPASCCSCDATEASGYCVECKDILCDDCIAAHQRVRITKDHTIVQRVSSKEPQGPNCSQHASETATAFCEKPCNRLVCWLCKDGEHKGHHVVDIQQNLDGVKADFKSILERSSKSRERVDRYLNTVKLSLDGLAGAEDLFRRNLAQYTLSIARMLRTAAGNLMKGAYTLSQVRRFQLEKFQMELTEYQSRLKHSESFINASMSDDCALLVGKSMVNKSTTALHLAAEASVSNTIKALCLPSMKFQPTKSLDQHVADLGSITSGNITWKASDTMENLRAILDRESSKIGIDNLDMEKEKSKDTTGSASKSTNDSVIMAADSSGQAPNIPPTTMSTGNLNISSQHKEGDPFDDYCSVCHDGGDLLCCDADDCSRVYHMQCHIPELTSEPNGLWTCTLCKSVNSIKETTVLGLSLSPRQQLICERILLELYCQPSTQIFHNPVSDSVEDYYKIIQHPMDFKTIRDRLSAKQYEMVEDFIIDLNLVFDNCVKFNGIDSPYGRVAESTRAVLASRVDLLVPRLNSLVTLPEDKTQK